MDWGLYVEEIKPLIVDYIDSNKRDDLILGYSDIIEVFGLRIIDLVKLFHGEDCYHEYINDSFRVRDVRDNSILYFEKYKLAKNRKGNLISNMFTGNVINKRVFEPHPGTNFKSSIEYSFDNHGKVIECSWLRHIFDSQNRLVIKENSNGCRMVLNYDDVKKLITIKLSAKLLDSPFNLTVGDWTKIDLPIEYKINIIDNKGEFIWWL